MFSVALVQKAIEFINNRRDDEEGQGLVEYALILVLISVVAIVIMRTLGDNVSGVFQSVSTQMTS